MIDTYIYLYLDVGLLEGRGFVSWKTKKCFIIFVVNGIFEKMFGCVSNACLHDFIVKMDYT
jgi:hypothetical protein